MGLIKDLATLIGHILPINHKAQGIKYTPTAPLTQDNVQEAIDALAGGATTGNSFTTIVTPSGTSPVADSSTDSLTLVDGSGITITGNATTDSVTIASTITQYTDELAQDAVGTILVDTASVDLNYSDGTPSISATVLPAGVNHNSLANLTTGDPHTQYPLSPATSIANGMVYFDDTSGRVLKSSGAMVDSGGVIEVTGVYCSGSTSTGTLSVDSTARFTSVTPNRMLYVETFANSLTTVANIAIDSSGILTITGQLNTDNLRLDGNTLSSQNANGAIILDPNGTGAIQLSAPTELGLNILKFGSANESSVFFDTALVIQPDVTSNAVTIGTATGTGSGDLLLNKIGIGGSAISSLAFINGAITTATGRQVLSFAITYTGTGASAGTAVLTFTDQGTNATYTLIGVQSTCSLNTTSHTTYTQSGFRGLVGIGIATGFTTGTYTFHGGRFTAANGVGGSHSGGTFRRYGVFIDPITALSGTPGTDLIMGIYNPESYNTIADKLLIFDSTATSLGDTSIGYVSASTDLRISVDGTLSFIHDADKNISKVDLKLDTAGSGIYIAEGSNATMGTATLVGGTVTVNTTKVTANSRIFCTVNNPSGGTGVVRNTARVNGTSFTLTSSSATDTSQVAWVILEPA